MKQFIDDIIKYLDDKFSNESSLAIKPKGHYAYEHGLVPDSKTPFYVVQLMDNSTSQEDFNQEISARMPIQIHVFGVKMKINDKISKAQDSSLILAELCTKFLNEYKYTSKSITSMNRTSCTPALPYEDGSKAYYSVIRYNIEIKMPYVSAQ